ncbi:acetyl-CoA carboxylase, biotin carboxylase subunit, partial [mine drainage metagenome]
GAEAIHPGYGFLAENAGFADACDAAGLRFIGPAASSIRDMGDKHRARTIALAAGVPVAPGSDKLKGDEIDKIEAAAQQIGFPLLLKAAAGGGGIGLRPVEAPADLLSSVEATSRMAERAFGDGSVYLERLIRVARHIEVQVFGFGDGDAVHLFDRECSLQRRYQKILEEARAPEVNESSRVEMARTAVALASTSKYRGAGTVEFLYDDE